MSPALADYACRSGDELVFEAQLHGQIPVELATKVAEFFRAMADENLVKNQINLKAIDGRPIVLHTILNKGVDQYEKAMTEAWRSHVGRELVFGQAPKTFSWWKPLKKLLKLILGDGD